MQAQKSPQRFARRRDRRRCRRHCSYVRSLQSTCIPRPVNLRSPLRADLRFPGRDQPPQCGPSGHRCPRLDRPPSSLWDWVRPARAVERYAWFTASRKGRAPEPRTTNVRSARPQLDIHALLAYGPDGRAQDPSIQPALRAVPYPETAPMARLAIHLGRHLPSRRELLGALLPALQNGSP